jgi:4-aminobutyrate aminotransferase / (S)-3-amino-2-methylpropionate transaminase / 5-aminovalerate transaminase
MSTNLSSALVTNEPAVDFATRDHPESSPDSEGRSEAIYAREQKYLMGLSGSARRLGRAFVRAQGCQVYDADGRQYLDFTAGVGIMSTGHCHPTVVAEVQRQFAAFVGWHDSASEARAQLVELLAGLLPERLRHLCLFSGGAETVEAALRLARCHTGRSRVVGFSGSYHGKTAAALAVTGHEARRGWWVPEEGHGGLLPYADCNRCPFQLERSSCNTFCAEGVRRSLEALVVDLPAAVIVEPAQGTQGNIIPPPEFLCAIQRWCRERGVLFICDEILVGCGRTGAMFAFESAGLSPDMLLLGKGIASGYPMGVLALSDEVAASQRINWVSAASSSFGGNPVAAAAAAATLRVLCDEGLIFNALRVGPTLLAGLRDLSKRFDFFRNPRGRGLLLGGDLVPDGRGGQRSQALGEQVVAEARARGLLLMSTSGSLRINPPLCISEPEARVGLERLGQALAAADPGRGPR